MYCADGKLKMAEKNSEILEQYELKLTTAKLSCNKKEEAHMYFHLGYEYLHLGDSKQAVENYMHCLRIVKQEGDRDQEGRVSCNLGLAYEKLGDIEQAITYHNQALIIAKELGDKAGEGRANCNLGTCYARLGDFNQAIEYHMQGLNIAKEVGDLDLEGKCYWNLGSAYSGLRNCKQAIEYCMQGLNTAKEVGDRDLEGKSYCNLGNAYYRLSDFQQAIKYHIQGLNIAKDVGDRDLEGWCYCDLGSAYSGLSNFKQAIEYYMQGLNIAKEVGDRDLEGMCYCNLAGGAYRHLGLFELSLKYSKQHLCIIKELGARREEGLCYGNLGIVYLQLRKLKQAIESFEKQLVIAKEVKDRDLEGHSYCYLGGAYDSLGDFKKSIEYLSQHLSIAKEVGDREGEACAYNSLGKVHGSLGDFNEAINCHRKSLIIAKETGYKMIEAEAHFWLGIVFELSNSLHEARDNYRSCVRLYNDVRSLLQSKDAWKISFRDYTKEKYTALYRTLVKLSNFTEALCVAEQGRAQALTDLMKRQYELESLPSETSEPDILSNVTAQTIFIALEWYRIYLWHRIYVWVVGNGNDVQFHQKHADHEYRIGIPCYCLKCLIKKAFKENDIGAPVNCEDRSLDALRDELPLNKESCHQMSESLSEEPSLDALRDEVPQGKESCHQMSESTQTNNNSLRLLYDTVVGPIANELKADELMIVPDGPLCLVPFAAFVDRDSRYLGESFRIRIIPSLTSLQLIKDCHESYHSKSGALLVGDPCVEEIKRNIFGIPRMPQLPYARKEVKMIGDIVNATPLVGKEATKDEVLKRIASVALVHIAAHGDMKTGEIALAPNPSREHNDPEPKDYMLKMADVNAVKLRARLVVLSCCHSGRGKMSAEGVVGIARAFLGSGARCVLASLWAIDDEATMEFMKSFYQHLKDGNTASTALNKAMKCLRESEKFSAVKYWAPFVIIGDDVTLEFEEKTNEQCE